MRNGILAAFALLLVAASTGCGNDADPRLSGDGHEPLIGTTWRVDRITGEGVDLKSAGLAEPPRILFAADDTMQAFTGCNTASARAAADDAFIRFGPVSVGRARCGGREERMEAGLLDPLRSRVKYEFDGPRLEFIGKEFKLYLSAMGSADLIGVPATVDRLVGRSFELDEVSGDVLTDDAPLDLEFGRGRLGVNVACNNQEYFYEIHKGTISGQVAMSTDMLCTGPEGQQERGFARLMRRGGKTSLTSERLILDFGDGVIARMSDSHEQLLGTEWRIKSLRMRDGTTKFPEGERPLLRLSEDASNYAFSTPCNDGGGGARLGDGEISFDQPTMSIMGCDRRRMRLEDAIESMFSGTATVSFDGPDLVLKKGFREFVYTPANGA